ncbi:class I SAM-dependent methyltransferase [Paraglaciecola sp.]|uniref:class I SAM-dependent methyltransferase n=1 Tax=Paraglaciecola sp. TaxID=1920173 RepID=UPI0032665447
MPTLFEIAQGCNTDKTMPSATHGHSYLHIYEKFLSFLDQYSSLRILEIGVRYGGSINMLQKRFPNAFVVGLDIEPCEFAVHDQSRYEFFQGRQDDTEILATITKKFESFDLIIDDGSHLISDYVNTFLFLQKYLRKTGFYIIEDLQNNYYEHNLTRSTKANNNGEQFNQFQAQMMKSLHLSKSYNLSNLSPNMFSIHHYPGFMVLTKSFVF